MDGSGRWAKAQSKNRSFGHLKGVKVAEEVVLFCLKQKIPVLSLFTLSSENTKRPQKEFNSLKKLLEQSILKKASFLTEKDIRLSFLGDLSIFSKKVRDGLLDLQEKTRNNKALHVCLALNYGGQQEIVEVCKKVAEKVQEKSLKLKDITKKTLIPFFPSSLIPPPDLILRTGGESRLSNFYLFFAAYSELHFSKTLWPDFSSKELESIIKSYLKVKRRFGKL